MQPFYFGDSRRQLFGVYHEPRSPVAAPEHGVLLCAPFGREYMSTHRAMRQLALQLSRAGRHVLRFDYSGTGDSAGAGEDVTVDAWLEDVRVAIQELQDTTGIGGVDLVGLRFGALIAATVGAGHPDVGQVVVWDPVVCGRQYVGELLRHARPVGRRPDSSPPGSGCPGIEGFALPGIFRTQVEAMDAATLPWRRDLTCTLIASDRRPEYERLCRAWSEARLPFAITHTDRPIGWDDVARFGAVMLPQEAIQAITALLVGEREACASAR